MNYKEKYEQALERVRIWKDKSGMPKNKQGILDEIFPELAESEDEKVRKDIISFLRSKNGYMNPDEDWDFHNRWLPWLKKQGTSYTKRDVDDAYVEDMAFAKNELENQGEQKSDPYNGVSFEYNGHIWGMCARDGGVEILMDSELKAFVSLDKSFIYHIHPQPILVPKSAMEAIKEEKVDNANKVDTRSNLNELLKQAMKDE